MNKETDHPKIELTPARESAFYNLLTIAGEQGVEFDRDLHAKNRRYWNGYFLKRIISDDAKAYWGHRLPKLSQRELKDIDRTMEKRGFSDWIIDGYNADLSGIRLEGRDLNLKGYCFNELRLDGLWLGGCLDCSRIEVRRNFFCRNANVENNVEFFGSTVGGNEGYDIRLEGTQIGGDLYFTGAELNGCCLHDTKIGGNVWFTKAHVGGALQMQRAEVRGGLTMTDAKLAGPFDVRSSKFLSMNLSSLVFKDVDAGVFFSDVEVKGSARFGGINFKVVPEFFGARLHDDTNWTGVGWPPASKTKEQAGENIRRYERLRFMMNQLKKTEDEQMFLQLSLREQRIRDGWFSPRTWFNLFYDLFCGHGYSVGKALSWWLVHLLAGAGLIGVMFNRLKPAGGRDCIAVIRDSLEVSFSNSLPFLGLNRTALKPAYEDLEGSTLTDWPLLNWVTFEAVWGSQVVIGSILFFLLVVTVRNIYRL